MNNEVRVLVMSPFDYIYGSKEHSYWCGDFFYLNPSSREEDLEELKFILNSSYLLRGLVYLEEPIKKDYKNSEGVFAPKIYIDEQTEDSTITETQEVDETSEESTSRELEPEEIQEQFAEESISESVKLNKEDLEAKPWTEIKSLAESLGIEYQNKKQAIADILTKQ